MNGDALRVRKSLRVVMSLPTMKLRTSCTMNRASERVMVKREGLRVNLAL